MFKKWFAKYARAVSDEREREWLYKKYCAKTVVSTIFYVLCIEKDGQHKVLWEVDTVLIDGKLYLTITQDNISDYEGETIVLLQKTVE